MRVAHTTGHCAIVPVNFPDKYGIKAGLDPNDSSIRYLGMCNKTSIHVIQALVLGGHFFTEIYLCDIDAATRKATLHILQKMVLEYPDNFCEPLRVDIYHGSLFDVIPHDVDQLDHSHTIQLAAVNLVVAPNDCQPQNILKKIHALTRRMPFCIRYTKTLDGPLGQEGMDLHQQVVTVTHVAPAVPTTPILVQILYASCTTQHQAHIAEYTPARPRLTHLTEEGLHVDNTPLRQPP